MGEKKKKRYKVKRECCEKYKKKGRCCKDCPQRDTCPLYNGPKEKK